MPKLSKRQLVGIKTETTQGTAASLAATDYLWVQDASVDVKVDRLSRDVSRSYLDPIPDLIGKRSYDVKFSTELKWSPNALGATASVYAPLCASLLACGLSGVTATDGSVSFLPSSNPPSASYNGPGRSATIYVNKDGIAHTITGAIGSYKVSAEAGKIGMIEFTFQGGYYEPADATFPSSTPNTTNPPIVESCRLLMHGFAPVASKLEADLGAKVVERPDVTSSNGLEGFLITGFEPKGSVDPEVETVATHNFYNRLINGTTGSLSAVIGNTVGNRITLTAAVVQYSDVKYGNRNDILTYSVPISFGSYDGNNSLIIKFT
jgi:hypothetical protein